MACIKGVSRSASVAIAPDAPYLVAGTMAGAVDPSFSSTANVEIFKLDFQSDDQDLPVAGGCTTTERFNRLSWGKNVSGSEEFSLGLIAGSFVDGTIGLWNPLNLIRANSGETAFVGNLSKHKGAVRGLEFNAITPNLLASGADEGEICIWDLAKPTDPSHFPPLKGSGSTAQGEISYLSWNSKVQHILASTSFNGKTVVWDLKKQKPVISFSDSTRARCSVLQWNPDVVTQLVVACDDDNSPSLKLWDMRNTMTPVMEFVGHTKGVIAMSWCPTDSSYLLTCAKDNRTICWDTSTAEIVCELPTGTNWNFDVHWYPKIPGVITASSFDGKIGIYNIEGCSRYGAGEIDFCAAPLRAPKWYRRPSGATFGFGGKLVFFHSKSSAAGINAVLSEVHVHDLVAEHGLVSRSTEFESAMKNGERSSLRILCDKKSHASETGDEKETWMFLKVMFEEEGNARTKLLTHLGFSAPVEEDSETDVSQHVRALNAESCDSVVGAGSTSAFLTDNGEDFFNNLPSPKADTPLSVSNRATFGVEERSTFSEDACDDVDACESSFEEGIRRALAVGDYRGAVQQCVAVNKMADALVIAHLGGTSLWEQTREQYLKMSPPSYLQVVSSMVNNDLMNLVKTRPLRLWKEVLALLCTFAHGEEWAVLCDTLALRLMNAGSVLAATLCFICAGNIDSTVGIWSQSLARGQMGRSYVDQLQDLMEKTIVLALATGQKRFSGSLNKLVEKYVEILVSQGLLTTAMEYLNLLGSESTSPELAILRDRIAASTLLPVKGVVEPVDHPPTVETSQGYYQEAVQQQQAVVPGGPYGENYQHSLSSPVYGSRGYMSASVPYQQQPHMFMPAHAPVVPPGNFTPLPATTQPAVRPFVPATPPVLKNAEQYQQPMTLGSQLFPGGGAAYHPPPASGPAVAGHMVVPPPSSMVPSLRGSGVVQRPAHPPQQQPPSPTSAAAQPPTVQTADTSSVRPQLRPVVATLTKLYLETTDAMGGPRAVPAKKREIDDNSKKIGALFAKLNTGDISDNASARLVHLCLALDAADYAAALQTQVLLTTSEWDECNFWLAALKRMIRTRQSIRLN